MDGNKEAVHDRWLARTEAAYRRMFAGKSQKELVTLAERERMAAMIGKELAAFLLEEHVALDPAVQPEKASTTCCPKCGEAGIPAVREGDELPERALTTSVGTIQLQRQRWCCPKCRINFFSVRRSAGSGDRRL